MKRGKKTAAQESIVSIHHASEMPIAFNFNGLLQKVGAFRETDRI